MATATTLTVAVRYTPGFSCPVPAETAYAALEAIRAKNPEGKVVAREVVKAASKTTHPLHLAGFTWDDKKAAAKCREGEAKLLTRSLVIVNLEKPEAPPQPVYLHVKELVGRDRPGYLPAAVVMSSADLRRQYLLGSVAVLRGWLKRHAADYELARAAELVEQAAAAATAAADSAA